MTSRARLRVENNRQSLKGFADNIEERRKREKSVQIYDNDIKTEFGLDMCGRGKYFFEVDDRTIYIRLYSDTLYNKNILDEKDREELKKLIKWLNTQERLEWVASKAFKMSDLYLYIRLKAAQDRDFLKWWQEYSFDINIFLYSRRKWYR